MEPEYNDIAEASKMLTESFIQDCVPLLCDVLESTLAEIALRSTVPFAAQRAQQGDGSSGQLRAESKGRRGSRDTNHGASTLDGTNSVRNSLNFNSTQTTFTGDAAGGGDADLSPLLTAMEAAAQFETEGRRWIAETKRKRTTRQNEESRRNGEMSVEDSASSISPTIYHQWKQTKKDNARPTEHPLARYWSQTLEREANAAKANTVFDADIVLASPSSNSSSFVSKTNHGDAATSEGSGQQAASQQLSRRSLSQTAFGSGRAVGAGGQTAPSFVAANSFASSRPRGGSLSTTRRSHSNSPSTAAHAQQPASPPSTSPMNASLANQSTASTGYFPPPPSISITLSSVTATAAATSARRESSLPLTGAQNPPSAPPTQAGPSVSSFSPQQLSQQYCDVVYHKLRGLHEVMHDTMRTALRYGEMPIATTPMRGLASLASAAAKTRMLSYTKMIDTVAALLIQIELGLFEALKNGTLGEANQHRYHQQKDHRMQILQGMAPSQLFNTDGDGLSPSVYHYAGREGPSAKADAVMLRIFQHLERITEQYGPVSFSGVYCRPHREQKSQWRASASDVHSSGAANTFDELPSPQGLGVDDGLSGRPRLLWLRTVLGADLGQGGNSSPFAASPVMQSQAGVFTSDVASPLGHHSPLTPHSPPNRDKSPDADGFIAVSSKGGATASDVLARSESQRDSPYLASRANSDFSGRPSPTTRASGNQLPFVPSLNATRNAAQQQRPVVHPRTASNGYLSSVVEVFTANRLQGADSSFDSPPQMFSSLSLSPQATLRVLFEPLVSVCFTSLYEALLKREWYIVPHDDDERCGRSGDYGCHLVSLALQEYGGPTMDALSVLKMYKRRSALANVDASYDRLTTLGNAEVVWELSGLLDPTAPPRQSKDSTAFPSEITDLLLMTNVVAETATARHLTAMLALSPSTLRRLIRRAMRVIAPCTIPPLPCFSEETAAKKGYPPPVPVETTVSLEARLRSLWSRAHSEATLRCASFLAFTSQADALSLKNSFYLSLMSDPSVFLTNTRRRSDNANAFFDQGGVLKGSLAGSNSLPLFLFDALPSLRDCVACTGGQDMLKLLRLRVDEVLKANEPVRSVILGPSQTSLATQKMVHERFWHFLTYITPEFVTLGTNEESATEVALCARLLLDNSKGCRTTKMFACRLLSNVFASAATFHGFSSLPERTRRVLEDVFSQKMSDWLTKLKYTPFSLPASAAVLCVCGKPTFVREAPKVFTALLKAASDTASYARHTRASFITSAGALMGHYLTFVLPPASALPLVPASADRPQLENTFRTMMNQFKDFGLNVLRKGPSIFPCSSQDHKVVGQTSTSASADLDHTSLLVAFADVLLTLCFLRPVTVGWPVLLECLPKDASQQGETREKDVSANASHTDLTAAALLSLRVITDFARDHMYTIALGPLAALSGPRSARARVVEDLLRFEVADTHFFIDGYWRANPYTRHVSDFQPLPDADFGFVSQSSFSVLNLNMRRSKFQIQTIGSIVGFTGLQDFNRFFDSSEILGSDSVDLSSFVAFADGMETKKSSRLAALVPIDSQSCLRDCFTHAAQWHALQAITTTTSNASPLPYVELLASVLSGCGMHPRQSGQFNLASTGFERLVRSLIFVTTSLEADVLPENPDEFDFGVCIDKHDVANGFSITDPFTSPRFDGRHNGVTKIASSDRPLLHCMTFITCLSAAALWEPRILLQTFIKNVPLSTSEAKGHSGSPAEATIISTDPSTFILAKCLMHRNHAFVRSVALESLLPSLLFYSDVAAPSFRALCSNFEDVQMLIREEHARVPELLGAARRSKSSDVLSSRLKARAALATGRQLYADTQETSSSLSGGESTSVADNSSNREGGGNASEKEELRRILNRAKMLADVRHVPLVNSLRLAAVGGCWEERLDALPQLSVWSKKDPCLSHSVFVKMIDACAALAARLSGPCARAIGFDRIQSQWLQAMIGVTSFALTFYVKAISQLPTDDFISQVSLISACIPPSVACAVVHACVSKIDLGMTGRESSLPSLPMSSSASVPIVFANLLSLPLIDCGSALSTMLLASSDTSVRLKALCLLKPLDQLGGMLANALASQQELSEFVLIERILLSKLESMCEDAIGSFEMESDASSPRSTPMTSRPISRSHYRDPSQPGDGKPQSFPVPKLALNASADVRASAACIDTAGLTFTATMIRARELFARLLCVPTMGGEAMSLMTAIATIAPQVLDETREVLQRTTAFGCVWNEIPTATSGLSADGDGRSRHASDVVTSNNFTALLASARLRKSGTSSPYSSVPVENTKKQKGDLEISRIDSEDNNLYFFATELAESNFPIIIVSQLLLQLAPIMSPFFSTALLCLNTSPANATATNTSSAGKTSPLVVHMPQKTDVVNLSDRGAADLWKAQFVITSVLTCLSHQHCEVLEQGMLAIDADKCFGDGFLALLLSPGGSTKMSQIPSKVINARFQFAESGYVASCVGRATDLLSYFAPTVVSLNHTKQDSFDTVWFVLDEVLLRTILTTHFENGALAKSVEPALVPTPFVPCGLASSVLEFAHKVTSDVSGSVVKKDPIRALLLSSIAVPALRIALALTSRPFEPRAPSLDHFFAYKSTSAVQRMEQRARCVETNIELADIAQIAPASDRNAPILLTKARLPTARVGVVENFQMYKLNFTSRSGNVSSTANNPNIILLRFIDIFDAVFFTLTGSNAGAGGSTAASQQAISALLVDTNNTKKDELLNKNCGLCQGALLPPLPAWQQLRGTLCVFDGEGHEFTYEDWAKNDSLKERIGFHWQHGIGMRVRESLFALLWQIATDANGANNPVKLPAFLNIDPTSDSAISKLLSEREAWASLQLAPRLRTLIPTPERGLLAPTVQPRASSLCSEFLMTRQGIFIDFIAQHVLYCSRPAASFISMCSTRVRVAQGGLSHSEPLFVSKCVTSYALFTQTLAAFVAFHLNTMLANEAIRQAQSVQTYCNSVASFEKSAPAANFAANGNAIFKPFPLPSFAIASFLFDPIRSNQGATSLFVLLAERLLAYSQSALSASLAVAAAAIENQYRKRTTSTDHPTPTLMLSEPIHAKAIGTMDVYTTLAPISFGGIRSILTSFLVACPTFGDMHIAQFCGSSVPSPFIASEICSPSKLVYYSIVAEATLIYPLLLIDKPSSSSAAVASAVGQIIPRWPATELFRVLEQRRVCRQLILQSLIIVVTGGVIVSRSHGADLFGTYPSRDAFVPDLPLGIARCSSLLMTARQVLAMVCLCRSGGSELTSEEMITRARHLSVSQKAAIKSDELSFWMELLFEVSTHGTGLRFSRPERSFFSFAWNALCNTLCPIFRAADGGSKSSPMPNTAALENDFAMLPKIVVEGCLQILCNCVLYHPGVAEVSFLRGLLALTHRFGFEKESVTKVTSEKGFNDHSFHHFIDTIWHHLELNRCPREIHLVSVSPSGAGDALATLGSAVSKIKTVATPVEKLAFHLVVGFYSLTIGDFKEDASSVSALTDREVDELLDGFLRNWKHKIGECQSANGMADPSSFDDEMCADDSPLTTESLGQKEASGDPTNTSTSAVDASSSDVEPPSYHPTTCTDDGLSELQLVLWKRATGLCLKRSLKGTGKGRVCEPSAALRKAIFIATGEGGGMGDADLERSVAFQVFKHAYIALGTIREQQTLGEAASSIQLEQRPDSPLQQEHVKVGRVFTDILVDALKPQSEIANRPMTSTSHGDPQTLGFWPLVSFIPTYLTLCERFPKNSARTAQLRKVGLSSPALFARLSNTITHFAPEVLKQHSVLKLLVAAEAGGEWKSVIPLYNSVTISRGGPISRIFTPSYSAVVVRQYSSAVQRAKNKAAASHNGAAAIHAERDGGDGGRFVNVHRPPTHAHAALVEDFGSNEQSAVQLPSERTYVLNETGTVKVYSAPAYRDEASISPVVHRNSGESQVLSNSRPSIAGAPSSGGLGQSLASDSLVPRTLNQSLQSVSLRGAGNTFGRNELSATFENSIEEASISEGGSSNAQVVTRLPMNSPQFTSGSPAHPSAPTAATGQVLGMDATHNALTRKLIEDTLTSNDWMVITLDTMSEISDYLAAIMLNSVLRRKMSSKVSDEKFIGAAFGLLEVQHLPHRLALDFLINATSSQAQRLDTTTQHTTARANREEAATRSPSPYATHKAHSVHPSVLELSVADMRSVSGLFAIETPIRATRSQLVSPSRSFAVIPPQAPTSTNPTAPRSPAIRPATTMPSTSPMLTPQPKPLRSRVSSQSVMKGVPPSVLEMSLSNIPGRATLPRTMSNATMIVHEGAAVCDPTATARGALGFSFIQNMRSPEVTMVQYGNGRGGVLLLPMTGDGLAAAAESERDGRARAVFNVLLRKVVNTFADLKAALEDSRQTVETLKLAQRGGPLGSSIDLFGHILSSLSADRRRHLLLNVGRWALDSYLHRFEGSLACTHKATAFVSHRRRSFAPPTSPQVAPKPPHGSPRPHPNTSLSNTTLFASQSSIQALPVSQLSQQQQALMAQSFVASVREVVGNMQTLQSLADDELRLLRSLVELLSGSFRECESEEQISNPPSVGEINPRVAAPCLQPFVPFLLLLHATLRRTMVKSASTIASLVKQLPCVSMASGSQGTMMHHHLTASASGGNLGNMGGVQLWEESINLTVKLLESGESLALAEFVGLPHTGSALRSVFEVIRRYALWSLGLVAPNFVRLSSSRNDGTPHSAASAALATLGEQLTECIPRAFICELPTEMAAVVYSSNRLNHAFPHASSKHPFHCSAFAWGALWMTLWCGCANPPKSPISVKFSTNAPLSSMSAWLVPHTNSLIFQLISGDMQGTPSIEALVGHCCERLQVPLKPTTASALTAASSLHDHHMSTLRTALREQLVLPLLFIGSRVWVAAADECPMFLRTASLKAQVWLLQLLALRHSVQQTGRYIFSKTAEQPPNRETVKGPQKSARVAGHGDAAHHRPSQRQQFADHHIAFALVDVTSELHNAVQYTALASDEDDALTCPLRWTDVAASKGSSVRDKSILLYPARAGEPTPSESDRQAFARDVRKLKLELRFQHLAAFSRIEADAGGAEEFDDNGDGAGPTARCDDAEAMMVAGASFTQGLVNAWTPLFATAMGSKLMTITVEPEQGSRSAASLSYSWQILEGSAIVGILHSQLGTIANTLGSGNSGAAFLCTNGVDTPDYQESVIPPAANEAIYEAFVFVDDVFNKKVPANGGEGGRKWDDDPIADLATEHYANAFSITKTAAKTLKRLERPSYMINYGRTVVTKMTPRQKSEVAGNDSPERQAGRLLTWAFDD